MSVGVGAGRVEALPESVALSPAALTLRWGDREATLPAARLRARCRCAPCRAAALRGDAAADPAAPGATLVDATPIGRYALQLRFGDGHERGIYPWAYLRAIADEASSRAP